MARFGVTYHDIANAADQLLGQGKNPTIENIRQLLGTGSSTTIANHLRKWRLDQEGNGNLVHKENLPEELLSLVKGLWQRLLHQADQQIQTIQQTSNEKMVVLQNELDKFKRNNQRWQQLFNQWQQEKERFLADKLTLEQGNQQLQKELQEKITQYIACSQQLEEKQERITELNRLHQQTQANLEHYRESAREQRLIEQQQFAQQKQEMQAEINQLKNQMAILQEQNIIHEQGYKKIQNDYKLLEQQYHQSQNILEKQQQTITQLEKNKNEADHASQHWQGLYQTLRTENHSHLVQLADLQAEIKILKKQLADNQKGLSHLQDQNKLLGNEKWILMQEKSQLEGQLKQMQEIIRPTA